ncbi:MAG: DUF6683 family protein [Pseudanabaenaceae cyanobacterium]
MLLKCGSWFWGLLLAMGGWLSGVPSVLAQYSNYLSPSMEYSTMWLANASFILSQAQQNHLLGLNVPLEGWQRHAAPKKRTTVAPFSQTDFRPVRSTPLPQQFAQLGQTPAERTAWQRYGQEVLQEIYKDKNFRPNNLTYALSLLIGSAVMTVNKTELSEAQSNQLLNDVHKFVLDSQMLQHLSAAAITTLHDQALIFAAIMTSLYGQGQAGVSRGIG